MAGFLAFQMNFSIYRSFLTFFKFARRITLKAPRVIPIVSNGGATMMKDSLEKIIGK